MRIVLYYPLYNILDRLSGFYNDHQAKFSHSDLQRIQSIFVHTNEILKILKKFNSVAYDTLTDDIQDRVQTHLTIIHEQTDMLLRDILAAVPTHHLLVIQSELQRFETLQSSAHVAS